MWSSLIELLFLPLDFAFQRLISFRIEGISLGGLVIAMFVIGAVSRQLVRTARAEIPNSQRTLNNERNENRKNEANQ